MPPRYWHQRITDMVECIESSREYVASLDFEAFRADAKTVKAVIRDLTVIGEAAVNVPDWLIERHPEVPWAKMRAMRDIVVHEYFGIDERIVWDTARNNLPPLAEPLRRLLEIEPDDG